MSNITKTVKYVFEFTLRIIITTYKTDGLFLAQKALILILLYISKNMSQTMISEYKLKLIDKKLLETKLKEMKNLIDNKDNQ